MYIVPKENLYLHAMTCISVCMYVCIYIYIYIYVEIEIDLCRLYACVQYVCDVYSAKLWQLDVGKTNSLILLGQNAEINIVSQLYT